MRVRLDDHTRLLDNGTTIAGGSPYARWSLASAETSALEDWRRGGTVPSDHSGLAKFAERLLLRGMIHPEPELPLSAAELTVVIPCRDSLERVRNTMAGLGLLRVIVVDDGSLVPVTVAALTDGCVQSHTVHVVRTSTSKGPGAARNAGLAQVATPSVAFIDAGVVINEASLLRLGSWLGQATTAVAPRVVSEPGSSRAQRYDQHRSPIDMGALEAPVHPGTRVPYVPTACLLARTQALRDIQGFDQSLRYGEDVDLVWRLRPGTVRYVPHVVAAYQQRSTVRGLARQRFAYGTSAAALSSKHGSDVAFLRMSPWSAGFWFLVFTGYPLAATGVAAYSVAALRRVLQSQDAAREAAQMVAVGNCWAGVALASAAVRAWAPLTVLGLLSKRFRFVAAVLTAIGFGRRLHDGPPTDRVNDVAVGIVDDLAAGIGVWRGVIAERSVRCLLPDLVDRTEF